MNQAAPIHKGDDPADCFGLNARGGSVSYKLTITQKPEYLHAVVTGVNSRENVERYLEEIRRECSARGCSRLLIEERLEGPRLGTMDVFQIAAEGSGRALGNFQAIAYVDVNAEGDLMQFAEDVAVNRFLPVRVFRSISEAAKWLRGESRGEAPDRSPNEAR